MLALRISGCGGAGGGIVDDDRVVAEAFEEDLAGLHGGHADARCRHGRQAGRNEDQQHQDGKPEGG